MVDLKNTIIICPLGTFFNWNHIGISNEYREDVLSNKLYLNSKYLWRPNPINIFKINH